MGHHAGMMGHHEKEWWVNMLRNLQATYFNNDTMKLNTKTATRSSQPTDRIFSAIRNSPFVLAVDSSAVVHSVAGIEELSSRMERLSQNSPDALELYRSSIKNVLNVEFIKQIMSNVANTFSHRRLTKELRWDDSTAVPGMEGLKMHSTYTVRRIDTCEVEINIFSDIKITDQSINIQGQMITASLTGMQEATTVVETHTSLIKQSDSKFTMNGNIKVMGTKVPVEISSSSSIKRQ